MFQFYKFTINFILKKMLEVQFRIEDFIRVLTTAAYEKEDIGKACENMESHPSVNENWKFDICKNMHTHTDASMFLEASIWDLLNVTITINILSCSKSII